MLLPITLTKSIPPKVEDVRVYFNQKGMTNAEAECFFLRYEKRSWRTKNGDFVKSWKNAAYRWISGILKDEPWRFEKDIH